MKPYTKSVRKLIDVFAKMPGVGNKSAERLALYVLKTSQEEAMEMAYAIRDVKKNIRPCSLCFNLAEDDICEICADQDRRRDILCVVEWPRDLIMIEKSGAYQGLYHVLMGRLSPVEGIGPEQLRVKELLARLDGGIKEVLLATNPTVEGDATAMYLAPLLREKQVRVTRLARGLPAGFELEFVPKTVIEDAVAGRQEFNG